MYLSYQIAALQQNCMIQIFLQRVGFGTSYLNIWSPNCTNPKQSGTWCSPLELPQMPQDTFDPLTTEVNVLGYLHPASLQLFAECSAVFQTESWTLEALRIWWIHQFPYRIRRKVDFHPFKKACLWRNWLEFWFFQALCKNIEKLVSHGHLAWVVPFHNWPWDGHYSTPNGFVSVVHRLEMCVVHCCFSFPAAVELRYPFKGLQFEFTSHLAFQNVLKSCHCTAPGFWELGFRKLKMLEWSLLSRDHVGCIVSPSQICWECRADLTCCRASEPISFFPGSMGPSVGEIGRVIKGYVPGDRIEMKEE